MIVVVFVFLKTSEKVAVALRLARIGEDWSHKASTPSNKNTVNFDGRFHDGPNEPPDYRSRFWGNISEGWLG